MVRLKGRGRCPVWMDVTPSRELWLILILGREPLSSRIRMMSPSRIRLPFTISLRVNLKLNIAMEGSIMDISAKNHLHQTARVQLSFLTMPSTMGVGRKVRCMARAPLHGKTDRPMKVSTSMAKSMGLAPSNSHQRNTIKVNGRLASRTARAQCMTRIVR